MTVTSTLLLINVNRKFTFALSQPSNSIASEDRAIHCDCDTLISSHCLSIKKIESNTWRALQCVLSLNMVWVMHVGYLYTNTEGCFIWLQHKAVAQAVREPVKYKETSHTTYCHYDNQAESFSPISRHSTQHRNPIAFKSYATNPWIRSACMAFNTSCKSEEDSWAF